MDTRQELSVELRRARGWLLGVGILQFVMDLVFLHLIYGDRILDSDKTRLTIMSGVIFAVFVALWWFAKARPKLCLTLGLVVFWGVHLWAATQDPKSLTQGILVKVFFTMALVKGLKSASRAEVLREELAKVFE